MPIFQPVMPRKAMKRAFFLMIAGLFCDSARTPAQSAPAAAQRLELTRAARPWEFLCATGKRAAWLGNESGRVEAWVYPLKIVRELRLSFLTDRREIPAESLVRTVIARPESTTLVFSGDIFRVRETFFTPVDTAGAVIEIEVETEQPLEVKVNFVRDFQLEWPAAMGGAGAAWDASLPGFAFGEDRQKFVALLGSPSAANPELEYETNYGASHTSSMRLGVTEKGRATKALFVAGSVNGRAEAEKTYKLLQTDYQRLWKESAAFYDSYLAKTVQLSLPDAELQRAYDWARVSLIQGLVSNPTMGDGLIAGYRTSGESYRPGFAWFFGRDSLWSSLALNSEGDFATTRTALEFIAKFQRDDGKIPHEIAQGASFVDWFKGYPYAYAAADATPLYIVGVDDYVTASGDVEFARANWEHIAKADAFMRSTYNSAGLPRNFGVGHGWVEGGPLLPVESEFYQGGVVAAAVRALAHLSEATGKTAEAKTLGASFAERRKQLNETFWSAETKRFAFAVDRDGKRVDEASVLATVPMWFGLTDEDKSAAMIGELAKGEHEADWGMRILSNRAQKYSGGGYHFGSVWPLFTGWAAVGEYRYHLAQPAYDNLRANALLALDGSPGHVTEVLSGDYYQPLSTSSPHQIWSAAMVISPMLRGMLGLQTDALQNKLILAPHLPAGWNELSVRGIAVGNRQVDLQLRRDGEAITLAADVKGGAVELEFSPSFSPRAEISGAALDGKSVAQRAETHGNDQHAVVRTTLANGSHVLKIRARNDFVVTYAARLPALGSASEGLRVISQSWDAARDTLKLETQGTPGRTYLLDVAGREQIISVDGARLTDDGKLEESFASTAATTGASTQTVTIHLAATKKR